MSIPGRRARDSTNFRSWTDRTVMGGMCWSAWMDTRGSFPQRLPDSAGCATGTKSDRVSELSGGLAS